MTSTSSLDELKQHLTELLGTQIDDVSYISPGHELKGQQNTCLIHEDVDHVYEEFKRMDILLWCYALTKKNKVECTSDNSKTQSVLVRVRMTQEKSPNLTLSVIIMCMNNI